MVMSLRYLVLYTASADIAEKAPVHYPAHRERFLEFHRDGTCLGIGTFADPRAPNAMGIFTAREAAEAFVAGDPFVLEGAVAHHEIREWDDALAG